jgi:hypothetical protein
LNVMCVAVISVLNLFPSTMGNHRMSSSKKSVKKPQISRRLDLVYCIFFFVTLGVSLCVNLLPLWPPQLQTLPITRRLYVVLRGYAEDTAKEIKDPFMISTLGLVEREWEFMYMTVIMWMELYVHVRNHYHSLCQLTAIDSYMSLHV